MFDLIYIIKHNLSLKNKSSTMLYQILNTFLDSKFVLVEYRNELLNVIFIFPIGIYIFYQ